MTTDRASKILASWLRSLKKRQGKLTLEDVEGTVINVACWVVLKGRNAKGSSVLRESGGSMNALELLERLVTPSDKEKEIAAAFAEAAQKLVAQYDATHAANARVAVMQNCAWPGMEDFLLNYFKDKHGKTISFQSSPKPSATEPDWIRFRSTTQRHFKQGVHSHDTSEVVTLKIRHVGGGCIEAVAPEHPQGLRAELSDSSFGAHAFVSDDLTRSFIVEAPEPDFATAEAITECRAMNNRTADFVVYAR